MKSESGDIPTDLSKSIFIAIPKKPGATECEMHRTISLMSHITKVILRVIMMRVRRKLKPEIGKEQCGFMEDTGTRNAIFMLRMLSERAIEMQKEVYVCFIDYTKAFDKVRHEDLMDILQDLDLDGKDIRLIRNLYWEQTACMRIDNEFGDSTQIKRGVRQGCVFSPDLFNLYSERIMRELDSAEGFVIGGHNLNNIRFADDAVLIAASKEKLQVLLNKVAEESKKRGLSINCKKTECMVISKKDSPSCELYLEGTLIKQVQKFIYLGSVITTSGKCDPEIKRRIALAKDAFQRLEHILRNRKISMETKKRVLECYVISTLTYGCECWTISAQMEERLKAAEMWFLRRMLRISYIDHVTNETVLIRANTTRKLMKIIRRRQLEFLGHVMRKEGMEDLILNGKIQGTRSRGRPRQTYMESLCNWMRNQLPEEEMKNITVINILRTTKDRQSWRAMIAYVLNGHGT